MKPKKVLFLPNGNTAVFSQKGRQIPRLQQPYILMFASFLEESEVDPLDVEFTMPDGAVVRLFKTPTGYNWQFC